MQAITTKSFGPSAKRNARIKVAAQAGYIYVDWDDSLNYENNHAKAAHVLAAKYGWTGPWVGGGLPAHGGMVWVHAADASDTFSVTPKEEAA